MAPSTLRKAIGAVKDQTSIGIAKVASNLAPDLEVAVVKATGHDNDPASEKYIREILQLTSYSRGYVSACVVTVSKRLGKTRDWIVALKCLMLVHRLLNEGDVDFQHEIMYATRRGTRLLNLSDFRDEAHSSSWDHSTFVRTYGLYLDQKLELMAYERKHNGKEGDNERFGGRDNRAGYRSPPKSSRGRDNEYGRDDMFDYSRGRDYEYSRDDRSSYSRGRDHEYGRDDRSGYSRGPPYEYGRDDRSGYPSHGSNTGCDYEYGRDDRSGYSRGRDYECGRDDRSGYSRGRNYEYGKDDRSGYRSHGSNMGRDYEYGRDDRPGYCSPETNKDHDYDYNGHRDEPNHRMHESRSSGDGRESRNDKKAATPLREMTLEKVLGKMSHLQRLLDRFLASRPTGLAKNERLILVALYILVKESFKLYADICEVLAVLLDKFFDMEHQDCVKAFDAYASAAKQIDELIGFYNWCKEIGMARSSEYPDVQRITDKLLETLDEFVRDGTKALKSPDRTAETEPTPEEEKPNDMNEVKALPPPENVAPPPAAEPEPPKPAVQETTYLVDLREVTADDQGNKLALALFAAPVANNGNGSWETFESNGEAEISSAWQNPAAGAGKGDWELALVESASHLSMQKAVMGGGLDSLHLDGMYDQGLVQQHVSTTQKNGGSASSVVLPGPGTSNTPILALPAPDGTVQTFGQDPFAASLSIPPPSYVQMADMETKHGMLMQEQMIWQQYSREGMQGQTSFTKIANPGYNAQPMMQYGMPPSGYSYAPF